MTDKFRAAVVGLGYFGRFHARHYAAHPDADLVAVVDVDPARAAAVAGEFGGEALSGYRDLKGRVDVASVAVPTSAHFEVASALIEAGIHVLIEKPVAETVQQADDLMALAGGRGLVVQVGHIERFSAVYREFSRIVKRPVYLSATRVSPYTPRATDVDVVRDLMIHDIDMVLALAASEVTDVRAVGGPVLSATADLANARIEFASGTVATITASRVAPKTERVLRVYQGDAYLVCDFVNSRIEHFARAGDPATMGAAAIATQSQDVAKEDSLFNEITEFLHCVRDRRMPTVDARVGRDALRVADMITDAIGDYQRRLESGHN